MLLQRENNNQLEDNTGAVLEDPLAGLTICTLNSELTCPVMGKSGADQWKKNS